MSIEKNIERIADALEAIAKGLQAGPAPAKPAPQDEAPAPKAEKKAPAPKAEKEAPPAPEPGATDEAPQDETPAAAPTLEELGKLVTGILGADATKRPAVVELLGKYGAKKVPEVPEDQRAEFKAGLEAIGGA